MSKDRKLKMNRNKTEKRSFHNLVNLLDAELLVNGKNSRKTLRSVISSDLISDILMYIEENSLLLTGLVNPQIIRVADMIDIGGIIFVVGKEPDEEVLNMAEEKNVPVAITESTLYEASGKLYRVGLKPCEYSGNCE